MLVWLSGTELKDSAPLQYHSLPRKRIPSQLHPSSTFTTYFHKIHLKLSFNLLLILPHGSFLWGSLTKLLCIAMHTN